MKLKLLFSISFIFMSLHLTSQDYIDCINAVEICDNSSRELIISVSTGQVDENVTLCGVEALFPDFFEEGSIWMKYQFISSGEFAFTIFPQNPSNDYDFTVFKSSTNDCNNLQPIRCMFTGENIGSPVDSMCIGPTGLSVTSTDTLESPGCTEPDDNFLASVSVNEGDVLFLAVKNFSLVTDPFLIEHTGDAEIGCVSTSTNSVIEEQVNIFPNPTTGILSINYINEYSNIEVFNPLGQRIFQAERTQSVEIDLSNQTAGFYMVKISEENGHGDFITRKIIKLD